MGNTQVLEYSNSILCGVTQECTDFKSDSVFQLICISNSKYKKNALKSDQLSSTVTGINYLESQIASQLFSQPGIH